MTLVEQSEMHYGIRSDSLVLLIGIGLEAASVAIGDWITTWYSSGKASFDVTMNYLMLDLMFYLVLLIIVPAALSSLRSIALFLFTWIVFIFVFAQFSSIGLF